MGGVVSRANQGTLRTVGRISPFAPRLGSLWEHFSAASSNAACLGLGAAPPPNVVSSSVSERLGGDEADEGELDPFAHGGGLSSSESDEVSAREGSPPCRH